MALIDAILEQLGPEEKRALAKRLRREGYGLEDFTMIRVQRHGSVSWPVEDLLMVNVRFDNHSRATVQVLAKVEVLEGHHITWVKRLRSGAWHIAEHVSLSAVACACGFDIHSSSRYRSSGSPCGVRCRSCLNSKAYKAFQRKHHVDH